MEKTIKAAELTPRDYALRYDKRLDNIYALLWAGKLPAVRRDGRWFIDATQLDSRGKRIAA